MTDAGGGSLPPQSGSRMRLDEYEEFSYEDDEPALDNPWDEIELEERGESE